MKISSRVVAGVTILHLEGRLICGSEPAPSLRGIFRELIEHGRLVVLVHMAGVTDMDAHGIGMLVGSLTMLGRHGGRMALIAPSAHVRRLLAITRLDTVFTVYDSEAEALVRNRPIAPPAASWPYRAWSDGTLVLDGSA